MAYIGAIPAAAVTTTTDIQDLTILNADIAEGTISGSKVDLTLHPNIVSTGKSLVLGD